MSSLSVMFYASRPYIKCMTYFIFTGHRKIIAVSFHFHFTKNFFLRAIRMWEFPVKMKLLLILSIVLEGVEVSLHTLPETSIFEGEYIQNY